MSESEKEMIGFKLPRPRLRIVLRAAYWVLTPWRLPERLQFFRDRAAKQAQARSVAVLIDGERSRMSALRSGNASGTEGALDLYDAADVVDAAGLPSEQVFWPTLSPREAVTDRTSAARFLMNTLQEHTELRARVPLALCGPDASVLVDWLCGPRGRSELNLASEEVPHLVALLAEDFAARARQFLLTRNDIRAVLPHGLLPSGRRSLWRWFMQHGLSEGKLTLEEVWWLFLQAAENPLGERVRAFRFTPDWQRLFPDALTVFGWSRFSAWVDQNYGSDDECEGAAEVALSVAAAFPEPSTQLRLAWLASSQWQATHPDALSSAPAAFALISWLSAGVDAQIEPEARAWCVALDADIVVPGLLNGGVNVIGHFCYPSGLRVSVEAVVKALGLAGIRTSLRDVRTDARDDPAHVRFDGMESGDITLIHAQPEPFFGEAYARADLAERNPRTYRIAYWYWEFDSIPDAWCDYAELVDEVWTATEFVAQGLRKRLSIPVRTLFPGVTLGQFKVRDRAYFQLDPGRFTFLFTFHMTSVMERKNPLGLIRAFKQAFRADEPVTLVLKTSFGDRHPEQFKELLHAAASGPTITIIDEVFSSDDVLSLMNACDAYVSLHRSEGLGLTMAEAMLMGKPVIATAFSGNMEFMHEDNSLLVPYERVRVGQSIPPYDADLEWAEPSVEHAARLMRRLFDDPQWAREVGALGRQSAKINFSLNAAGQRMAARLEEITAARRLTPS